jgi:hypothetical protein
MRLAPLRTILGLLPFALCIASCTAAADGPSKGTYTVQFPSTEAAVATDTVQLLVFEGPKPADRASYCQNLIQGRRRKDPQTPLVRSRPANICELLQGRQPIEIPYGEKAVLAVGQRAAVDFLIGCVIQTFGEGDAPLDIDLTLVDLGEPVPVTDCKSVSAACTEGKCTRR